jgi:uncharacterized protein (DUF4415 family)
MKKANSKRMTAEQSAELNALAKMPDARINTRDLPEQRDWSGARRGVFFRPIKRQLTLRLDADIIEWFKNQVADGDGYQTRINAALRAYVAQHGRE